MPRFQYTARNSDNDVVTGTVDAASEEAARTELTARGMSEIHLRSSDETGPASTESPDRSERAEVVFDDHVGNAFETIVQSGLPLESGLRMLADSHPSQRVSSGLNRLSERLARGESWAQIAQEKNEAVPPIYRQLFQLSLSPSQLSDVLNRYLSYTRHGAAIRRKIWTGLFYSLVIVASLVCLTGFLLMEIVPQFKAIFEGFDTELPASTIGLIEFADFFNHYGWGLLLAITFAVIFAWSFGGIAVRRVMQRISRIIPVSGKAFEGTALGTFCHLLAEFVKRKVPLQVALTLAAAGSRDLTLQRDCELIAADLKEGIPLDAALFKLNHFPRQLTHPFRWTSRPREFVDALHATGDSFHGQALTRAGVISMVVEPFLLFFVLVIVTTVGSALFAPLVKLLNDLS